VHRFLRTDPVRHCLTILMLGMHQECCTAVARRTIRFSASRE
jgi:hypothetical protein